MSNVDDRIKQMMNQKGGERKAASKKPMSPDEIWEQTKKETSEAGGSKKTYDDFEDFQEPKRKKRKRRRLFRKRPGKWTPTWWQKVLLTVGFLLAIYMLARISISLVGSWQSAATSTINTDTGKIRAYTHVEYMEYVQRHSKRAVSSEQLVDYMVEHNVSLRRAEKELIWSAWKQALVMATGWMFTGNHWSFKSWARFSMNFSLFLIVAVIGVMVIWNLIANYRDAKLDHNEKEQWIYIAWHALPQWKLVGGAVAFVVGVLQGVGSFRAWYLKAFLIVVVALILLKVLKSRALRRIGYRLQESVDLEKLAPELAKKLQERKCKQSDYIRRRRRRNSGWR